MNVCSTILETIGNTPLVKLNRITRELPCEVYAKLEYFNPGQSIKDRMALKMIQDAERDGRLKTGGTLIESTSGNTGMGLALAAIARGYRCVFTTNDKQSKEKIDILRALGAEVVVCPTQVEPEDPRSYYSVARRLEREIPGACYLNQYDNLSNRQAHYDQTGPEIWTQTDGRITHLVVATGTGGTITGCAMYLKEQQPGIQVWAIDAYGSLLKTYHDTGRIEPREVYPYITEGIGEDFVPANYDMSLIDRFEKVSDKDGALMARRLAREEGLFCGYSAGSALQGLMQLREHLKPGDQVVVIFHDHGSRYVTKIYNDQWMMERGFLRARSVQDLISARPAQTLVTIDASEAVSQAVALMKRYDIQHLPVLDQDRLVGAISESGLFGQIIDDPAIRDAAVRDLMQAPFPQVSPDTPIERLSAYINKDNGAVLSQDEAGRYHIITKYDILQSLASR